MQNLDYIDEFIKKAVSKNENLSMSALFRNMRKKVNLIGDYPILKHIAKVAKENGVIFERGQVLRALQSSPEYKESTRGEKINWAKDLTL